MNVKDILCNGGCRVLGKVYAKEFVGNLTGNADSATSLSTTLPVSKGGTGSTTLTSGYALIGNGTNNVSLRAITNNSTVNNLGWTSNVGTNLITANTLAYWNGQYANGSSNLAYCYKGAFGDAAIKGVDTSVTNGSNNLITSGAIYTALAEKANSSHTHNYLPLSGGKLTGALTVDDTVSVDVLSGTNAYSATEKYLKIESVVRFQASSFSPDRYFTESNLGESGYEWNNVYANTLHGNLDGNASTATALTTSGGSSTTPVYFNGGKPVVCTISTTPTSGSSNLITSGAVYSSLEKKMGLSSSGVVTTSVTLTVKPGDIVILNAAGSGASTWVLGIYSATQYMRTGVAGLESSWAIGSMGNAISLSNGNLTFTKVSAFSSMDYMHWSLGA